MVISTGTASGKSLCYQIPIIDGLLNEEESVFLLLFPTKALAADQEKKFKELLAVSRRFPFSSAINNYLIGSYDGDTDRNLRAKIRKNARILLTNPDMLHIGILPQHPSWGQFFLNLKLVILDEVHSYSGVFGSHVANILRRLKRIAGYYGSKPRFILSSATISNPLDHAKRIDRRKL